MLLKIPSFAAALALALAATAQAQNPDRKAKDAEQERIEAAYEADKAKCESMDGNAQDLCEAEAKAKRKVAKAELDAKHDASPRAQRKVEEARAEAEYDVAKQRCEANKDDSVCKKEAKARYDRARAAAGSSRSGAAQK